jgi:CheY-like chemotaxis protein
MLSAVEELVYKLLCPVRMLVVEDRRAVSQSCEAIKARYECEVDWAVTAAEMLEKCASHKYDLVLVNACLPGAVRLVRRLKRDQPTQPVVVLVLGAEAGELTEVARNAPVVVVGQSVNFGDVFQMFRMRVREKKDAAYFESRQRELDQHRLAPATL